MFLIDNFVITNIEVANIVCDMQNMLTLWWLMHCGKLAVIVWFVDKHLTSWFSMWYGKLRVTVWFVNRHSVWCGKLRVTVWSINRHCVIHQQTFCEVWKTSGHRVIHQQTLCDSSTDILCGVENFGSPCDSSTYIWYFVIHQQTFDSLCDVENMRLRVIRQQTFCMMWKTCDFVWYVNRHFVWCGKHATSCEPSFCVMWKTFDFAWSVNRLSVWCGKLSITVCTNYLCGVESLRLRGFRQQTFNVSWKTYSQNTFRKHDIDIIVYHVKL